MRDFTLNIYQNLIETVISSGYSGIAFEDYINNNYQNKKIYILRHDVDDLPYNSVRTAQIESELGARGTYYFRKMPQSDVPETIEKIAKLGHEIGYHYEDLATCNGNYEKAFEQYQINLEYFRKYYPVTTICMHGSPLSKWDNRLIWKKYDYKQSGIIAEPYFDIDFNKVLYLTDTSRKWNNRESSIRDKVNGLNVKIKSTNNLIELLKQNNLSSHIMQNIHPQRWTNDYLSWTKELLFQNTKNIIKRILIRSN